MDDDFKYVVDEETYNELVRLLDEEPRGYPKLKKLMNRTAPWEKD